MAPIIILAIIMMALLYIAAVRGYLAGMVWLCMALPGTAWEKIKQTFLAMCELLGFIRFNKKLMNKRGSCEDDFC